MPHPTAVVTTHLQMLAPPAAPPRALPPGLRLDRADAMTPEYARFLYALVGGDWHWTDRLGWTRDEWAAELDRPGTEFWVLYSGGVPQGYAQLHVEEPGEVELRYFGLAGTAMGLGVGGVLLEHVVAAAWTLHERTAVPRPARVWVHTCSLDGPAALGNYRARGFEAYRVDETEQAVADRPLGTWASTGGPF